MKEKLEKIREVLRCAIHDVTTTERTDKYFNGITILDSIIAELDSPCELELEQWNDYDIKVVGKPIWYAQRIDTAYKFEFHKCQKITDKIVSLVNAKTEKPMDNLQERIEHYLNAERGETTEHHDALIRDMQARTGEQDTSKDKFIAALKEIKKLINHHDEGDKPVRYVLRAIYDETEAALKEAE